MDKHVRVILPATAYPRFNHFQRRVKSIFPRFLKFIRKDEYGLSKLGSSCMEQRIEQWENGLKIPPEIILLNNPWDESVLGEQISAAVVKPEALKKAPAPQIYHWQQEDPKDDPSYLPRVVLCVIDTRKEWHKIFSETVREVTKANTGLHWNRNLKVFVYGKETLDDEDKTFIREDIKQYLKEDNLKEDIFVYQKTVGENISKCLELEVLESFADILRYLSLFRRPEPEKKGIQTKVTEEKEIINKLRHLLKDFNDNKTLLADAILCKTRPDVAANESPKQYAAQAVCERIRSIIIQEIAANRNITESLVCSVAGDHLVDKWRCLTDDTKTKLCFGFTSIGELRNGATVPNEHSEKLESKEEERKQKEQPKILGNKQEETVSEFEKLAWTIAQEIKLLEILKLDSIISKAESALRTLDQFEFEVKAALKQSDLMREVVGPSVPKPPKEVTDKILKFKEIDGCGLVFGKFQINLDPEVQKVDDVKANVEELLKEYKHDYCFEHHRMVGKCYSGICVGDTIWGIEKEHYGTLGAFVTCSVGHVYAVTCAHVVSSSTAIYGKDDNNEVRQVGSVSTKVGYGDSDSCTFHDIAAIKIEEGVRGECSNKFIDRDDEAHVFSLYDGELNDSFSDVYKRGASSGYTEGIIASEFQQKMFGGIVKDVICISSPPGSDEVFAKPGDSGAVILANSIDDEMFAIAMLRAGGFEGRQSEQAQNEQNNTEVKNNSMPCDNSNSEPVDCDSENGMVRQKGSARSNLNLTHNARQQCYQAVEQNVLLGSPIKCQPSKRSFLITNYAGPGKEECSDKIIFSFHLASALKELEKRNGNNNFKLLQQTT